MQQEVNNKSNLHTHTHTLRFFNQNPHSLRNVAKRGGGTGLGNAA